MNNHRAAAVSADPRRSPRTHNSDSSDRKSGGITSTEMPGPNRHTAAAEHPDRNDERKYDCRLRQRLPSLLPTSLPWSALNHEYRVLIQGSLVCLFRKSPIAQSAYLHNLRFLLLGLRLGRNQK